ncbi:hemerythrin domain-containing protein [bacterium]|nr:hemerythrin domain-containing protein [bacterium]
MMFLHMRLSFMAYRRSFLPLCAGEVNGVVGSSSEFKVRSTQVLSGEGTPARECQTCGPRKGPRMRETVFDVLKREHKEIKQLLQKAEKDPREYARFAEELETHVSAEERTVYSPLKQEKQVHEMVLEGFEEHHVVHLIMQEMESQTAGSEEWEAKLKVMSENLEHHIEEEEKQLFPAAEKAIGREHAVEMAEQYQSAERELVGATGRS